MAVVNCSRGMLLLSLVLYLQYTKAQNGPCRDNVSTLQPCSRQRLTAVYINLYHKSYSDTARCRCRVTGNQGDYINIKVTNVPGIISCGTNVSIFEPDGSIKPIHCTNELESVSLTQLGANDTISLEFSTSAYSTSPPFCIYIADFGSKRMDVSCIELTSTTMPMSSSQMTSTATSVSSSVTTFIQSSSAKLSQTNTFSIITLSNSGNASLKSVPVQKEVLISAIGGGILLILVVVIVVVCIRTRRSTNETVNSHTLEKDDKHDEIHANENKTMYDDDGMRINLLYESSDGIENLALKNVSYGDEQGRYAEIELPETGNSKADNVNQFDQKQLEAPVPVYSMADSGNIKGRVQSSKEVHIYDLPVS